MAIIKQIVRTGEWQWEQRTIEENQAGVVEALLDMSDK
jgi:hypothetical protein